MTTRDDCVALDDADALAPLREIVHPERRRDLPGRQLARSRVVVGALRACNEVIDERVGARDWCAVGTRQWMDRPTRARGPHRAA